MSEHRAEVLWERKTKDYQYETYDRTHSIKFEGGIKIQGSAAAEFMGKAALVNPEELLVAALSSCHMLTFLAVAAKSRLVVDRYEDSPVGILEKNVEGKLAVTKTTLRPKVRFSQDTPVSSEKLKDLHDKAHRNCFIANSVSCEVVTEIQ